MVLDMDSRVVAVGNVASSELGAESVLMDVESGKYFVLNEVSAEIWRAVQTPCRVGTLCDRLAAAYDAPAEKIRSSTLAFLKSLGDRGLISHLDNDLPA